MAEGQGMTTVADVVAQVRDGRLEDFVREAVVLVTRELMEEDGGRCWAWRGRARAEVHAPECVSPAGVGDEGRRDLAAGLSQAGRVGVLPQLPGAAPGV